MFQKVQAGVIYSCHSSKGRHVRDPKRLSVPLLWVMSVISPTWALAAVSAPASCEAPLRKHAQASSIYLVFPLTRSHHGLQTISHSSSKWTESTVTFSFVALSAPAALVSTLWFPTSRTTHCTWQPGEEGSEEDGRGFSMMLINPVVGGGPTCP